MTTLSTHVIGLFDDCVGIIDCIFRMITRVNPIVRTRLPDLIRASLTSPQSGDHTIETARLTKMSACSSRGVKAARSR